MFDKVFDFNTAVEGRRVCEAGEPEGKGDRHATVPARGDPDAQSLFVSVAYIRTHAVRGYATVLPEADIRVVMPLAVSTDEQS